MVDELLFHGILWFYKTLLVAHVKCLTRTDAAVVPVTPL